jgi:hypothetical protein
MKFNSSMDLYNYQKQEYLILGLVVAVLAVISIGVSDNKNYLVFAQTTDTTTTTTNTTTSVTPSTSNTNTTLSNVTTYNANGFIRSVITPEVDPLVPYLIYGSWDASIQNQNLNEFNANFTMARINGSETHTHQITNFKPIGSVSLQGGPLGSSILYSGVVDVLTNDNPKWKDVPAVITIADFDTISIALDTIKTDDHFNGQLIDGVVQSVKTTEGQELLLIVMEPAPIMIPVVPQNNTTTTTANNNMTNSSSR